MKVKDHRKFAHNVDLIRKRMKDLQRLLNALANKLKQVEDDTSKI